MKPAEACYAICMVESVKLEDHKRQVADDIRIAATQDKKLKLIRHLNELCIAGAKLAEHMEHHENTFRAMHDSEGDICKDDVVVLPDFSSRCN